jgi:hypothetical protein
MNDTELRESILNYLATGKNIGVIMDKIVKTVKPFDEDYTKALTYVSAMLSRLIKEGLITTFKGITYKGTYVIYYVLV